jgi:hypothetical protein
MSACIFYRFMRETYIIYTRDICEREIYILIDRLCIFCYISVEVYIFEDIYILIEIEIEIGIDFIFIYILIYKAGHFIFIYFGNCLLVLWLG